ncbi:hypothetical protein [Aliamphritea spongicola]|nr:hypothetical protein [Aliamphritea spongicola]
MKTRGSLFIVHLDTEAHTVEGDERLLSLIKEFRPKKSSILSSRQPSINFINSIEWYPSTPDGILWLMDVLYVAFRNILYCDNALNGIYNFGLEKSMFYKGLNSNDASTLRKIRLGKYAFRSENVKNLGFIGPDSDSLTGLMQTLTGSTSNISEGGKTKWWKNWKYDYWDERLIERAIINEEINAPYFINQLKKHNYNRRALPTEAKRLVESGRYNQNDRFGI